MREAGKMRILITLLSVVYTTANMIPSKNYFMPTPQFLEVSSNNDRYELQPDNYQLRPQNLPYSENTLESEYHPDHKTHNHHGINLQQPDQNKIFESYNLPQTHKNPNNIHTLKLVPYDPKVLQFYDVTEDQGQLKGINEIFIDQTKSPEHKCHDILHEDHVTTNDVTVHPGSSYIVNLMEAEKLFADLESDTHIEDAMTFLDAKPHYNALMNVLLALAENNITPICADFDLYYEDRYFSVVEEYYPNGLLSAGLVSDKVKYYTKLFSKKISQIKHLTEVECVRRGLSITCENLLNVMTASSNKLKREVFLLQALADLSASYGHISGELMKVSERYLELPYLLKSKGALKDLVKKLYYVLEFISPPKSACIRPTKTF